MESKLDLFFEDIYNSGIVNKLNEDLGSIFITHVMPTTINYILFVNKIWKVDSVIGIPYSLDLKTVDFLRNKGINVLTPETISEVPEIAMTVIRKLHKEQKFAVVQEVGGYLAPYLDEIKTLGNIVGIVEDTAQGHWRYQKNDNKQVPIISIAFSTLKNVEDTIVGDAVVYSTERILRENFWDVIQGKKSLVMGYGKIGKSCAIALKGRESVVSVYDSNPIQNITARVEGYKTGDLVELVSEADIIIGASGSTSLSGEIFEEIKDGAILASGSSRDIEFDVKNLMDNYCIEKNDLIWKCGNKKGNTFFVLNEGKPVNFRDLGILGPYLDLVFGELFYSMLKVGTNHVENGLGVNNEDERKLIAQYFYNRFLSENSSKNNRTAITI